MKLIKKNLKPLLIFIFLGLVIGTLSWDILERLISYSGKTLTLTTAPIGFDLRVISFFIRLNPGSLAGTAGGIMLFKSL